MQLPGIHIDFYNLSKIYGPIYTLYFGANRGVILNTPEVWFEALNEKQDETAVRPNLKSLGYLTKYGHGVAMNNGPRWRQIRTILQTSVTNKQLGEAAEPLIMEEMNATLFWLRQEVEAGRGSTFNLRLLCRRESLNVAMRKIFSFRFKSEMTQSFLNTQDWIRIIFDNISQGSPADFMPIFGMFPDPKRKKFHKTCDAMHKFLDDELAKHRREIGSKKKADYDFMDSMIAVQNEAKQLRKTDPNAFMMSDEDITISSWDMVAGAIDTSATTMEWLIMALVNHPRVQAKLHAIMDEVVGPNRLPCLADIPKLEYLTAVLDEIVRWKHFAPQGLPHEASQDITLGGFNIPKGTHIFFNFYSLHHNPKYWNKPEEFRPERFLEEDRELLDTILHSETFFKNPKAYKFVPYGQGRRRCVGYGLGRIVLWLKAAAWIHAFKWESANGQPLDLDTTTLGITLFPLEQQVKAIPRPAARILISEDSLSNIEGR